MNGAVPLGLLRSTAGMRSILIGLLLTTPLVCSYAQVPVDGLTLWLDATDPGTVHVNGEGLVDRWDNKAIRSTGGVSSTGRCRPHFLAREGRMIRPAIFFDGVDDVLSDPSFNHRAACWTLVVVAAPSAGGGGGLVTAASLAGNDYDPGFTIDLYSSGAQFDCISVEGAGRIGGQQDQMDRAYPYDTIHVIVVERDEKIVRLFIDGMVEGVRPVLPATTVMDALRIGARYYDGSERAYFCGEVCQVLLYDRVLKPAERATIEQQFFVSSAEREALAKEVKDRRLERERNRMVAAHRVESWPTIKAFLQDQPDGRIGALHRDVSELPIRTDIKKAIALSMTHLVSLFDADRNDEPFFFANCRADGTGEMHHSLEIGIPHVVGRCLLGGIAGQQATKIPFESKGLSILERYCKQSFDNPYALNAYIDPKRNNEPVVEFHNMREGLFGLWALIVAEDSTWATDMAAKMVRMLDSITDDNGVWSDTLLANSVLRDHYSGKSIPNAARMVDALLAYYRASGDSVAMELADDYARAGLKQMFNEEGHFAPMDQSSGHVHSITSSLSGITDYAIQVGDNAMLAKCIRIMRNGVPEYFSSWGWGDEVFPDHPANVVGRGEINQTGDIIRTALLLGDAGHPEFYEMAERWLRDMMLPTQHREAELRAFMHDNPNPKSDAEYNVIARSVGGYAMQHPNDRMGADDWPISTLDITSGAVHAMSACYTHRVTKSDTAYQLNLLFSYEDPGITIESNLPREGRIAFHLRLAGALRVRIPEWVDRSTLHLTVDGENREPVVQNGYLETSGKTGLLTFDIPCKVEMETVDGTEYTTTWIGNQVVDILPRGSVSPIPF